MAFITFYRGGMLRYLLAVAAFLSLVSAHNATADDNKISDVRIVIDISGSMKKTDPDNLRASALNLLVDLLPEGSQAGVWTFGRYVNMLVPLDKVDEQWRVQAKKNGESINSAGLYTNLVGALEKSLWKIHKDSHYEHNIILLTDGKIDMPATSNSAINQQEKQRLLNTLLPACIEQGIKIHTVALSDKADVNMLRSMALDTGGLFLQATTSDQLLKAFLKAFDRSVPVEQVPLENNRFTIDGSIREFTALIFRRSSRIPTELTSPAGESLTYQSSQNNPAVRWHQDLNFDLITVSDPGEGNWLIVADMDPDNRVQVLTDLSLDVSGLPNNIFSGYPIDLTMALKERGEVINDDTLLRLTDISIKVTAPDGRTGSKLLSDPEQLPADGQFKESLTRLSQQGEYEIEVTAQGRTFQRRKTLTTTLIEPLVVHTEPDYEQQVMNIIVKPEVDGVDTKLSRVIARISSPDNSSVIHAMEFSDAEQQWQLALSPDKGEGHYDVLLNIRGVTSAGTTFKSKPETISADFPLMKPVTDSDKSVQEKAVMAESEMELSASADIQADSNTSPEIEQQRQPPPQAGQTEMSVEEADMESPQTEQVKDEEAEPEIASPSEPVEQPETSVKEAAQAAMEQVQEEKKEEAIAWWVYALLALVNLSALGGGAYWWFGKRKHTQSSDFDDMDLESAEDGLDISPDPDGADDEQRSPDIDTPDIDPSRLDDGVNAADNDAEEEATPAEAERKPPSETPDNDFDIAEETTPEDDDWGEFDEPEDGDQEKKAN